MQNDMRDRLIELLNFVQCKAECCSALDGGRCGDLDHLDRCQIETITDHLIANGVVLPPCKVGDTVYTIFEREIEILEIIQIKTEENSKGISRCYDARNNFLIMPFSDCHIGKSIFLTKDQAEQKLKELSENG